MDIQNVELKGFSIFTKREIIFLPRDINLIIGNNEAGKSTLCLSIPAILYGFSNKLFYKTKKSWNACEEFIGRLQIFHNGSVFQITRDFNTDNTEIIECTGKNRKQLFIGDANSRGRTESVKAYFKLIHDGLGIPSIEVFTNSAYIPQLNIQISISDELRKQISGAGNADYLKSLDLLRTDYYKLTKLPLAGDGQKKQDRLIEVISKNIQKLEAELQITEDQISKSRDISSQLSTVNSQLKDKLSLQTTLKKENESLSHYLSLNREREDLKKQLELLEEKQKRLDDLQLGIKRLEKELEAGIFNELQSLSDEELESLEQYVNSDAESIKTQISEISNKRKILRDIISDEKYRQFSNVPHDFELIIHNTINYSKQVRNLISQLSQHPQTNQENIRFSIMSYVYIFVGSIALGLITYVISRGIFDSSSNLPIFFGVGISLISLIIASIINFFIYLSKKSNYSTISSLNDGLQREREKLTKSVNEVTKLIGRNISIEDIHELEILLSNFQDYQTSKKMIDELEKQENLLSSNRVFDCLNNKQVNAIISKHNNEFIREKIKLYWDLERRIVNMEDDLRKYQSSDIPDDTNVKDRLEDIIVELSRIEKNKPTYIEFRTDKTPGFAHLESIREKLQILEKDITSLQSHQRSLEIQYGQFEVTESRNPELINEELAKVNADYKYYLDQINAYNIAISTLSKIIPEYEETHLGKLSELSSTYFRNFTLGKYCGVDFSPEREPVILYHDPSKLSIQDVSIGTRDQLYLAMRLAIIDILGNRQDLPLILDDTFINFDKARREAAISNIKEISKNRQVILFSCNPDYREYAGNIIEL